MIRGSRLPGYGVALGVMTLLLSAHADAQWATFGKVETIADIYWLKRNVEEQIQNWNEDELRLGVEFRQSGYWEDPRILAFDYSVRPSFSVREDRSGKRDNDAVNYRVAINILRGALLPVEGSLVSTLSDNEFKATLAGTSTSRSRSNSAMLSWKFAPFPLRFDVTELSSTSKSASVFSPGVINREEFQRTFSITGQSSKLKMSLQHDSREERAREFESKWKIDTARLTHNFWWGRNSTLESRFDYRRREQFQAYSRTQFQQNSHIQHKVNLKSKLGYRLNETSGVVDSKGRSVSYSLNHSLYGNLASSAFLYASSQKSEFSRYNQNGGGASLNYSKDFFGSRVGLDALLSRTANEVISKGGIIEKIDEAYQFPTEGQVLLTSRYIRPESVIITDPTGRTIYLEGIDYEILGVASGLLLVSIIPGGELEAGQSILVSYIADAEPSGKYDENTKSFGVSFNRGNLGFAHRELRSDSDLIEGFVPNELVNRQERHTSLSYGWETRVGGFQLIATADTYQELGNRTRTWALYASGSFVITPSLDLTLSINHQQGSIESFGEAGDGEEAGDTVELQFDTARLTMNWRATASLAIRPSILAWKRNYEFLNRPLNSYDDDIISAQIDFAYKFRKFSANLKAFYNDSEILRTAPNPNYVRTDNGFYLTIRRYF